MPFFNQEDIKAAVGYKYRGKDDSILVKLIYRRFWDATIKLFPTCIAPNVITFVGFLAEIISFFISFFISRGMTVELPTWCCLMNGFCLFFYQLMDNLDGRQARRTQMSSALGQFFDHGCDAITGVLELGKVAMTLSLGCTPRTFWFIVIMGIGFGITSWEEYVTHEFYLGPINGPDEGLTLLWIAQIAAAFFPAQLKAFAKSDVVAVLFILGLIGTIGGIMINVIKRIIKGSGEDHVGMIGRLLGIIPMTITFLIYVLLFVAHNSLIFNPYFILCAGLNIQFMAQIVITSFLTQRPVHKLFTIPTIITWIFTLTALFVSSVNSIEWFWFAGFAGILFFMIYYDCRVIFGLSRGMGVPIFTVRKKE